MNVNLVRFSITSKIRPIPFTPCFLAYPYLSLTTQQQVKTYLQTNYGPGAKYDFTKIVHIGWGTGAAREVFDIPTEVSN